MEKIEIIKMLGMLVVSMAGGSILALRINWKRGNNRSNKGKTRTMESMKINIRGGGGNGKI